MAAQHAPVSERPGRLVRHVQRDAQLQRSGNQQTEEEEEESAGVLQEDDRLLPQTHMSTCGRVSCSALCVWRWQLLIEGPDGAGPADYAQAARCLANAQLQAIPFDR